MRERTTQTILILVSLYGGLDDTQHRKRETRERPEERLNGHLPGLEDWAKRPAGQPPSRTVHVDRSRTRRHAASIQDECVLLDLS